MGDARNHLVSRAVQPLPMEIVMYKQTQILIYPGMTLKKTDMNMDVRTMDILLLASNLGGQVSLDQALLLLYLSNVVSLKHEYKNNKNNNPN